MFAYSSTASNKQTGAQTRNNVTIMTHSRWLASGDYYNNYISNQPAIRTRTSCTLCWTQICLQMRQLCWQMVCVAAWLIQHLVPSRHRETGEGVHTLLRRTPVQRSVSNGTKVWKQGTNPSRVSICTWPWNSVRCFKSTRRSIGSNNVKTAQLSSWRSSAQQTTISLTNVQVQITLHI